MSSAVHLPEKPSHAGPSGTHRSALPRRLITVVLVIYTIVTFVPFYLLFVRSFVPTDISTQAHFWIPTLREFDMDSTYGAMGTYYTLDTKRFKRSMGITGYVSPNTTFTQLAEQFDIPEQRILDYLNPYVRFNGWFTILTDDRFISSLVATVTLTVAGILVGGFLGICTGSVPARFRKRWHRWVYNLYMLQIIIPPIMVILPLYLILGKYLGLRDSYAALFLLFVKGGAVSTMLFTAYISTIPSELKESVDVDGGSRPAFFFSVLIPLAKVPFASYMAIHFPLFWNDLLHARVFLSPERLTIVPLIDSFQGFYTTNYQAIYAGLMVSIIPIMIVYLVFQELFVRSALAGALKG